jgi:plastocyanin
MMAISKMQIQKHLWPLCVMIVILLTSPFTLDVCAKTAHAATGANEGAKVSIANFAFAPAEITIAPGESITWTNDDGAPHELEFDDATPGSDLLLPGARFSRRFDRPGTYDYNCSVHPYMTGRVVVHAP